MFQRVLPQGVKAAEPFPMSTNAALQSPECLYRKFDGLDLSAFADELSPYMPLKCDVMPQTPLMKERLAIFDGFYWSRWTSEHWEIPITACILYLIMIVSLKSYMAKREKFGLQNIVVFWNFGLSFFSFCGLYYCVPQLLFGEQAGLLEHGWYPSVCAHSSSYGFGKTGFFVALFIYSKLAELLDTTWLLLKKAPVILLHWYHHLTVLLYCWHSYSARIGTGLWFAAMNYSVHAVMYFYFGLTQLGPKGKKFAKKFAMLITTLQLTQMVFGIAVTVSSVVYHASGAVCYVSLVNSGLGLLMYTSYFVLFLQLFIDHYVIKKK